MPEAMFTVRISSIRGQDDCDERIPRTINLERIGKKHEGLHPYCEKVPYVNSSKVNSSTRTSCYLQLWEMDRFAEGAVLQFMETDTNERTNRLHMAIPGVVARSVVNGKAVYRFLATEEPRFFTTQEGHSPPLGKATFRIQHVGSSDPTDHILLVGEYETIFEFAGVLRINIQNRNFGMSHNAPPHLIKNVEASLWQELMHRNGFAMAFVTDYASSAGNNLEFAHQAEEMLATLPTFIATNNSVAMGFNLITHYGQIGHMMQGTRQAVQEFLNLEDAPLISCIAIYAHGEPHAINTDPNDWGVASGTLRKTNVSAFVDQIKDHILNDAVISLYACHNARTASAIDKNLPVNRRRFQDKMYGKPYPCEEVGGDSLAWWLHRVLVEKGKPFCTVYAHSTAGHTTRNNYLRVFSHWGSADIVNIIIGARRVPQNRIVNYQSETVWGNDTPGSQSYKDHIRNGNCIRKLTTFSAKYFSFAWCGGPDRDSGREGQYSFDIEKQFEDSQNTLRQFLNANQNVLEDEFVYEDETRKYIVGLAQGGDPRLSENFVYHEVSNVAFPLRLSVQLMKNLQILRDRTSVSMTPQLIAEDGNLIGIKVSANSNQKVLTAAQRMVDQGFFTSAELHNNVINLYLEAPCPCPPPEENYPYDQETFELITSIKHLIVGFSEYYQVSPVAIAGAIADEYNTRRGLKRSIDWFQDEILLNWMPNFAIEFDAFIGADNPFQNATKHDIGIGNIKLETAKAIYEEHKETFEHRHWDYSDLVDYIRSDEGTVHIAALVIRKAKQIFDNYTTVYSEKRKEAVQVTYYKQGDSYLRRFEDTLRDNPYHLISPGEGCRVCLQRDEILAALGLF